MGLTRGARLSGEGGGCTKVAHSNSYSYGRQPTMDGTALPLCTRRSPPNGLPNLLRPRLCDYSYHLMPTTKYLLGSTAELVRHGTGKATVASFKEAIRQARGEGPAAAVLAGSKRAARKPQAL